MDSEDDIGTKTDDNSNMPLPRKILRLMRKNLLLILLLMSLLVGIGLGAGLRLVDPPLGTREIFYLRFPGDLLMNMLKMLILPLIVSSLISGLASLDARASGKMGLRAVVYYLATTFLAVIIGIVLTVSIQPGKRGGDPDDLGEGEERIVNTADTFLDLLRYNLRRSMTKSTKWRMLPTKTRISLGIHPVWSVFVVRMKKLWVLSYP